MSPRRYMQECSQQPNTAVIAKHQKQANQQEIG